MDAIDHDGKCELARQADIIDAIGSWEAFNQLPEKTRTFLMSEAGMEGPVSDCKCSARKRNRDDFVRLWTAAGPAKNYNKESWKDVERQLLGVDEI